MKAFILIPTIVGMTMAFDPTIYQFTMQDINGEDVGLDSYKGKVVLVVNVASECGFTPQYEELQSLYEQRKDEGLVILGFPANNFGGQEPGSDEAIKTFCEQNYGVTFPMFSKISVEGDDTHPLYQFLTTKEMNGVMDSEVKWNFQKYVIDKEGKLREMIVPRKSVLNDDIVALIDELLGE